MSTFGTVTYITYFRDKYPRILPSIGETIKMAKPEPINLVPIADPIATGIHASARVAFGKTFVPQQQILLYSPSEWETFIQEWVHSQKSKYNKVLRFAGANDMGIDVAGLTDDKGIFGIWDNFQCKHYTDPLIPSKSAVEVGKVLWHSFNKRYAPPRKYHFIAPKDCGIALNRMLLKHDTLKAYIVKHWDQYCKKEITDTEEIELKGDFEKYVDAFDYTIFTSKPCLEIIDEHRTTPWHTIRFGGGLPERAPVAPPPAEVGVHESRYLTQLFEAYSDYKGITLTDVTSLSPWKELDEHYDRQRESFYHAEALRNFARDTVPPGTFEELQDEVYAGVIDIENAEHTNAFVRLNNVTHASTSLELTSNALISVVKVQDRKGICHQLANVNKLNWKKP